MPNRVTDSGMDTDGFGRSKSRSAIRKANVRYWTPINLIGSAGFTAGYVGGERTMTRISASGASVFTTLEIGIGDRVKFSAKNMTF